MKHIVAIFVSAFALFATASQAAELGLGVAETSHGKGLDVTIQDTDASQIHLQAGQMNDQKRFYGTADYDLLAPVSKNVSVYAGLGVKDISATGPAARIPLGVQAKFDRLPVAVALEVAPTFVRTETGMHQTSDSTFAIRYILK